MLWGQTCAAALTSLTRKGRSQGLPFYSFQGINPLRIVDSTARCMMCGSFKCSLIRLQRTGLVGLWRNAKVVRQRLVEANHQATSSRPSWAVLEKPVADEALPTARCGLSTRSVYGASNPL